MIRSTESEWSEGENQTNNCFLLLTWIVELEENVAKMLGGFVAKLVDLPVRGEEFFHLLKKCLIVERRIIEIEHDEQFVRPIDTFERMFGVERQGAFDVSVNGRTSNRSDGKHLVVVRLTEFDRRGDEADAPNIRRLSSVLHK